MAYGKRKIFRKRRPTKKSTKKTYRKPGMYGKTFAKAVKKIISRQAENKTQQAYQPNYPIYNKTHANFALSMFPVCPYSTSLQIDQGVSQSQRIGNRIKIKNLVFDCTVYPKPYNASTNINPQPYVVKFWFYYDKTNPNSLVGPDSSFLQLGGTAQALTGNLIDASAPVNTDRWRILTTRTIKVGYSAVTGTGSSTGNEFFQNNDFKLNSRFKINLTKYLVKNVKYNDTNSVPTTRGLFCIAEAIDGVGGGTSASTIPCEMFYTLNMSYEDM